MNKIIPSPETLFLHRKGFRNLYETESKKFATAMKKISKLEGDFDSPRFLQ